MSILSNPGVWTAFLALVNIVVRYALPDLPAEIFAAVNVLVVAVLAALGIQVNKAIARAAAK